MTSSNDALWARTRGDLLLVPNLAYLDHAAASVPPRQVIDAMTDYLSRTAQVGPYLPAFRKETYARVEAVRAAAAAFIGAQAEEIAFTKNGTEAISLIARGLRWQPGDEVIITNAEIMSNQAPWLRLQEAGLVNVRVVPVDDGGMIPLDVLAAMLTPRTRLISVSHLPNATGALQPIEAICTLARARGILTLINASQSLGLVPIDVRALGCDFLAACGRKALRGPEGSGLLFARAELIPQMEPALVGWWNAGFDIATQAVTLQTTAKRFEAGCPIVPSILGLGAAIEYANGIGISAIHQRVRALTDYTVAQLRTLDGIELYGPARDADRLMIVPFNVRGVGADAIVARLEAEGVIIEAGHFMALPILQRHGIDKMVRISPLYFNTEAEIDRAVAGIRALAAETASA
ncbi:aminotransferase class V-fold PLP-dependent enzyme [uncultured Ralstonia sp.]|jgi:cysteine desulfurase/selenocysteine lyase|uniref:aminotransferase class V-fold PLP-dependent enzyme n=1 Tax=Ralstonia sp. TaxID=54061 RepID=UPI001EABEA32|nr:aminotransferase class V-fold PLP-dependent enzyme [uncultured Ralstonia sp.]UCF23026.1 MAG: aminotransferase class V-fold PLP-dependent enzyme [Ralstonia sp.]